MIVTVTANPAVDVTYRVSELVLGTALRVRSVHRQAGGKGVNVARVLRSMGVEVLALAPVGGATGEEIRADLERSEIRHELVPVRATSRQTVTAVDDRGRSIELDEPGAALTSLEWERLLAAAASQLRAGGVVALSGSLPPGAPADGYGVLVELAHRRGATVVLDTSGAALEAALAAGPDVVKPDEAELSTFYGAGVGSPQSALEACQKLLQAGAGAVVASRGELGALVRSAEAAWWISHGARSGNAVGAGDALVAGLASGLEQGLPLVDSAHRGVLWAYASLASDFAGCVDPDEVERQRDAITLASVEDPRVVPLSRGRTKEA